MDLGPAGRRGRHVAEPVQERLAHLDRPVALPGDRQHLGEAALHRDEHGISVFGEHPRPVEGRLGRRERPAAQRPPGDLEQERGGLPTVAGLLGELGGELAGVTGQARVSGLERGQRLR